MANQPARLEGCCLPSAAGRCSLRVLLAAALFLCSCCAAVPSALFIIKTRNHSTFRRDVPQGYRYPQASLQDQRPVEPLAAVHRLSLVQAAEARQVDRGRVRQVRVEDAALLIRRQLDDVLVQKVYAVQVAGVGLLGEDQEAPGLDEQLELRAVGLRKFEGASAGQGEDVHEGVVEGAVGVRVDADALVVLVDEAVVDRESGVVEQAAFLRGGREGVRRAPGGRAAGAPGGRGPRR